MKSTPSSRPDERRRPERTCTTRFLNDYNYPLVEELYVPAYTAFTGIIAQRECPGDFDKDGSSDEADLCRLCRGFRQNRLRRRLLQR